MDTHSLRACVGAVVLLAGCASPHRPYLPDLPQQASVPTSRALPIDGVWQCTHGVQIRIEKGRAYVVSGRTYADYDGPGVPPGSVFARGIRPARGLRYACETATANWNERRWAYGPAELDLTGLDTLVLRVAPNPAAGGTQGWEDSYRPIRLDRPLSVRMAVLMADNEAVSRELRRKALADIAARDRSLLVKVAQKCPDGEIRAAARTMSRPKPKPAPAKVGAAFEPLRDADRAAHLALAAEVVKAGPGARFVMPDVRAVARQPVGCLTIRQPLPKRQELLVEYDRAALAATVTVDKPVGLCGWIDREANYAFTGEGALAKLAATSIASRTTRAVPAETGRIVAMPLRLQKAQDENLSLQLLVLTPLGHGSVHRFLGHVSMAELGMPGWYTNGVKEIHSDEDDPLVFAVTEVGYVHLGGKGTLVFELEEQKKLGMPDLRIEPGRPVELTKLQRWRLAGEPDEATREFLEAGRKPIAARTGGTVTSEAPLSGSFQFEKGRVVVTRDLGFHVDRTGRLVIGE